MKRVIAIVLCVIIMMYPCIPVLAETERYGTLKVEFSDAVGTIEHLQIMVENGNVYANAEKLAERFGYLVEKNEECVVVHNTFENKELPFCLTKFYYDKTKVENMVYSRVLENYEAPFPARCNERGAWIPLEYSLLILNSGMMLVGDTALIDMPEKKLQDLFYNISTNANLYPFEWSKDFGYTDAESTILGASGHMINQFNGLLKFDGASWEQMFLSILGNSSAYDKKYGQNIAMLLCTESDGELKKASEEVGKILKLFDDEGKIGKRLSNCNASLDADVGVLYQECENLLDDIKNSNSSVAKYNQTYDALEKALDKQTWFSKTGGTILEVQKGVSDAVSVLDTAVKVAEVVQYGVEFANQDKFSVAALDCYLENSNGVEDSDDVIKHSMKEYSDILKGNLVEYSATRFFKENADDWVGEAIKNGNLLGSQADMILVAWNLASGFVPFISNGLSAADNFELTLYAMNFQKNTQINYQKYRDYVFGEEKNITEENLYRLAQYCYLYMKACYITRSAAIATLEGKRESVKKQIKPLLEQQNGINDEIAEMLVMLKKAKETNENLLYGFLPADNEEYLDGYKNQKSKLFEHIIYQNATELTDEQINILENEIDITNKNSDKNEETNKFLDIFSKLYEEFSNYFGEDFENMIEDFLDFLHEKLPDFYNEIRDVLSLKKEGKSNWFSLFFVRF